MSGLVTPDAVLVDRTTLDVFEELYGEPRDVEWARAEGVFGILQARPVTTEVPPAPEVRNASLGTDSLWTGADLGEAVPDITTPATWSFVRRFIGDVRVGATLHGRPLYGNLGGRFFLIGADPLAGLPAGSDLLCDLDRTAGRPAMLPRADLARESR
ncbi:hypothetical protein ACF09C_01475 [Streptomyces sp. NPDC014870]|uniref:hypothetical protein n=1 Tax=Streptomyces sp. NPDC014870 TaxID=3364925 RepID=UPI0036F9316A